MTGQGSPIDRLTADYLRRRAGLDPAEAVSLGLADVPPGLTDYGPEGAAARADLSRSLLAAVAAQAPAGQRDRVAAEVIGDRLSVQLDWYEAGEWMREVRVIGSPLHAIREAFELLPRDTADDWEQVADRLGQVPRSLASWRAALAAGVRSGTVAARRQALACARHAAAIAAGYFRGFVADRPGGGLGERLTAAAEVADRAYASLADYLAGDYAAAASEEDGVGRERYQLACRQQTGLDLDLEDTYGWGWAELRRIQAEMTAVAGQITPGGGTGEAIHLLDTDPSRAIEGTGAFLGWLQQLMDSTVEALAGIHFDIPGPVRTVEAHLTPPESAAAMYYSPPSEDFSRPGRIWYPDTGRERIPAWREISTAYHEGVPGHHLQLGYTCWLGDRLNPFQRHHGAVSGHTEGWALYAERLMSELGYLDNPDYLLGMLTAQAYRAARAVIDIGMHLGLRLPASQPFHPGERWTPELAAPFLVAVGGSCCTPAACIATEVDRYLGWPAQAITYKVGERAWLATRERVRQREGARFSLRRFHQRAFELGPVGLGQLEQELASG